VDEGRKVRKIVLIGGEMYHVVDALERPLHDRSVRDISRKEFGFLR
jgi:hypothetical protein